MLRYKLTDSLGLTHADTPWGPGLSHSTSGIGDLCGPGWLHCYTDPVLAVLLNPIHANFAEPRLCEVEVSGLSKLDHGLKEGWTEMAFLRWLDLPAVTLVQCVAFGILCAKEVYKEPSWLAWADNWLSGQGRSWAAVKDAAAVYAASYAASDAAYAAAYAATAYATVTTATAAYAAANAASSCAAATHNAEIDLIALAKAALEVS